VSCIASTLIVSLPLFQKSKFYFTHGQYDDSMYTEAQRNQEETLHKVNAVILFFNCLDWWWSRRSTKPIQLFSPQKESEDESTISKAVESDGISPMEDDDNPFWTNTSLSCDALLIHLYNFHLASPSVCCMYVTCNIRNEFVYLL